MDKRERFEAAAEAGRIRETYGRDFPPHGGSNAAHPMFGFENNEWMRYRIGVLLSYFPEYEGKWGAKLSELDAI